MNQPIRNGVYDVQSCSNVASSSRDFNNDPSILRFAIMGDRTGGMLPGVTSGISDEQNVYFERVRLVPAEIRLVVPPHRDTTITVRLEDEELDLQELNESDLSLEFQVTYDTETGNLSLPTS